MGDEEYLERLSAAYRFPVSGFHPDLVVYVAGADPYREDQLGGLSLTLDGLMRRDRLVIETALREGTPVAIVLAGGYAIQGRAGRYIPRIEGCYFNVVGLPLARLQQALTSLGWSED